MLGALMLKAASPVTALTHSRHAHAHMPHTRQALHFAMAEYPRVGSRLVRYEGRPQVRGPDPPQTVASVTGLMV